MSNSLSTKFYEKKYTTPFDWTMIDAINEAAPISLNFSGLPLFIFQIFNDKNILPFCDIL